MAIQAYSLTFVLRLAGSDVDTMQQTVAIAAETVIEAIELSRFYRDGLPSGAIVSATLADADGVVLWTEQNGSAPDEVLLQDDQP